MSESIPLVICIFLVFTQTFRRVFLYQEVTSGKWDNPWCITKKSCIFDACLMTLTLYNSNNSLTPGFKWALFQKRNSLDKLINIPKYLWSKISLMTQDQNIKTGTIRNPRQNSQLIYEPQCFQNPRNRLIHSKNAQSAHFLRQNWILRSENSV